MSKENQDQKDFTKSNAAVMYCRVSTLDQVENGCSLDAQVDRLSSYAAVCGLEVIAVFREEAVSGCIPLKDRPEGRS